MDVQEIRYERAQRLEDVLNKALASPGVHQIVIRIKYFDTQKEEGYDAYFVAILATKLEKHGLLVDYGTIMDDKTSRDILWVQPKPPQLEVKAEIKK